MIYLVRHSEAEVNIARGWVGDRNSSPLTELGETQAKKTADYFKDKNISRIISSPVVRAYETANFISKKIKIIVERNEDIHELYFGKLDGYADFLNFADDNLKNDWENKPWTVTFPEGESFKDIENRCKKFINKLKTNENIIVVAHRDIIRMILSIIKNDNHKTFWNYKLTKASISILENNNEKFSIVKTDIIDHLK